MEKQTYPDQYQYPGGPPMPPYDLAGWTLPMQMGVDFVRATESLDRKSTRLNSSHLGISYAVFCLKKKNKTKKKKIIKKNYKLNS